MKYIRMMVRKYLWLTLTAGFLFGVIYTAAGQANQTICTRVGTLETIFIMSMLVMWWGGSIIAGFDLAKPDGQQ